MKKTIYIFLRFAAICCFVMLGFSACADSDDELENQGDVEIATQVDFRLLLNLPIQSTNTRVNTIPGGDDTVSAASTNEKLIDVSDIYVLRFDSSNNLVDYITDLSNQGQNDQGDLILTKTLEIENTSYSLMILANLQDQGITSSTGDASATEIKQLLTDHLGASRAAIKQLLKYKFTEKWDIESRRIPMWGTYEDAISFNKRAISCSANLYRAISKIHILVNAASRDTEGLGLSNFDMTSVRIYYATKDGFSAPVVATPNPDASIQFTQTDIPSGADQFDIDNPLVWEPVAGSTTLGNTFINQIYLPESNNSTSAVTPTATTTTPQKVKIVVGGTYHGNGLSETEVPTYYRIDLADYNPTNNAITEYNLIRNHSYVFNIISVEGPGTPTPKQALDQDVASMTTDAYDVVEGLRTINTQYTLTTNKSYVSYTHEEMDTKYVTVGLENYPEGWDLIDNETADWCTIVREGNKVKITPLSVNSSILRQTQFYIKAGNIQKQIIVLQDQPESANCYIADDGTHEINVTIKGNGFLGSEIECVNICNDLKLEPAYLKIIWETKAGLVQLESEPNENDWGASQANYDSDSGSIRYNVNTGSSYDNASYTHHENANGTDEIQDHGGNALIGAFDVDNKIIWSWHIWVCPDIFDATEPGNVKETCLEDWTLNGYMVMDRNLGALSNQPGVSSLGLLYQWGRKDPFIGAASISETTDPIVTYDPNIIPIENWGVNTNETLTETNAIDYTVKHPKILIQDGLSEILDNSIGEDLWGTSKGFDPNTTNLGLKTVYDPCPPGYRVPPVDAFVFTDTIKNWRYYGNGDTHTVVKSSLNFNWTENLIYVPHCVYQATMGNQLIKYLYYGPYVNDAPYYGFFIDYQEFKVPAPLNWENDTHRFNSGHERDRSWGNWFWRLSNENYFEDDEYCYLSENPEDFAVHFYFMSYNWKDEIEWSDTNRDQAAIQIENQEDYAWFPISGAYDPGTSDGSSDNKGFGFNGVSVTQGSSITVNSFLWTNSSDEVAGTVRPCAMFLHGAEHSNSRGSGRHIHSLTGMHDEPGRVGSYSDDIHAEPQQASAVRCIRDVKKDFSALNTIITENVSLAKDIGSEIGGTVTSINQPWQVTDPGDSWVVMTPDQGEADNGVGTPVTFRALSTNTTGAVRTTTIKVHFNGETGDREITITQAQ